MKLLKIRNAFIVNVYYTFLIRLMLSLFYDQVKKPTGEMQIHKESTLPVLVHRLDSVIAQLKLS